MRKVLYLSLFSVLFCFIYILILYQHDIISNRKESENISEISYSFHHCLNEKDTQRTSCLFENICYDNNISDFIYYKENTTNRQATMPFVRITTEYDHKDSMQPKILYSSIPNDVIWLDSELSILIVALWPDNFGHLLDSVFSVFNIMKRYESLSHDFQLLFQKDSDCESVVPTDKIENVCSKYLQVFSKLTNRKSLSIGKAFPFLPSNSVICMKKLLAGTSSFGMNRDVVGNFNKFVRYLIPLHIQDPLQIPIPGKQSIIIINKLEGRRLVTNFNELQSYLESLFLVDVIIENHISDMTIEEQIYMMRKYSVMVTPCGGISFSSLFMTPGASAVYIGFWNVEIEQPDHMEKYIWTAQVDIRDFYYNVYKNESTLKNVPDEDISNFYQWRNYADVTLNLPRMGRVVYDALYSAERRFRWTNSFSRG